MRSLADNPYGQRGYVYLSQDTPTSEAPDKSLDNMSRVSNNTSYDRFSAKKEERHPIRGAIIGYFVGGLVGTIFQLFLPVAGWISVILGVIIGILTG